MKSSQGLRLRIIPSRCNRCKACGLHFNQAPLVDIVSKKAKVFWVGLSAVYMDATTDKMPLSADTRTGALIHEIEAPFSKQVTFYRTNVVKCLPLTDDKMRYPTETEMQRCSPNLEEELRLHKPSVVFLLGKQVSDFVARHFLGERFKHKSTFGFEPILFNGCLFVPVYHPSYMLVYKRKDISKYINSIRSYIPAKSQLQNK